MLCPTPVSMLTTKVKLKSTLDLGQMPSRYPSGVGALARYVLQYLSFLVACKPDLTPKHRSHDQLPLNTIPYVSRREREGDVLDGLASQQHRSPFLQVHPKLEGETLVPP